MLKISITHKYNKTHYNKKTLQPRCRADNNCILCARICLNNNYIIYSQEKDQTKLITLSSGPKCTYNIIIAMHFWKIFFLIIY